MDINDILLNSYAVSKNRCCFLLEVKKECLFEYLEIHQRVWDEMLDALRNTGWKNYSLFIRKEDGLIVGYFESDDIELAIKNMSKQEINSIWQKEMSKYFKQPNGGNMQILSQYFYLP